MLYVWRRFPLFSKPKNQRVKRALQKREPKIVENDKHALFLKGGRTSETIAEALKDLVCIVSREIYVRLGQWPTENI